MFQLKKIIKNLAFIIAVVVSSLTLTYVAFAVWKEPGDTAPNGNVDAPINVGLAAQTKIGDLFIQNAANTAELKSNLLSVDGEAVVGNTVGTTYGLLVPNGRVGIGTTTPSVNSSLHIMKTSGWAEERIESTDPFAGADLHFENDKGTGANGSFSVGLEGSGGDGSFRIEQHKWSDDIWMRRFTIDSTTGNVGIGTEVAGAKLTVDGSVSIGSGAGNDAAVPGQALCITAAKKIGTCSGPVSGTGDCSCQAIN